MPKMHTPESSPNCKEFGKGIASFPSVRIAMQAVVVPSSSSSKESSAAPQGIPTFVLTLQNQVATLSEHAVNLGKKKDSREDKEQAPMVKKQGGNTDTGETTISMLVTRQVSTPTERTGLGWGGFAVAQETTSTQGGSEATPPSLSATPEPATVPVATRNVQQQVLPEKAIAVEAEEVAPQEQASAQEAQSVPAKGLAVKMADAAALAPPAPISAAQRTTGGVAGSALVLPASLIADSMNEQIPGLAAMMQGAKASASQRKEAQGRGMEMPAAAPPSQDAPKAHLAPQGNESPTQTLTPEQTSGSVSTLSRPSTATSMLQGVTTNKAAANAKEASQPTALQTVPSGMDATNIQSTGMPLVAVPTAAASGDGAAQESPESSTAGNSYAAVAAVDGPRSKAHATRADASAGPLGVAQPGAPTGANLLAVAGRSTAGIASQELGRNVTAQSAPSTTEASEAIKNEHEPIVELPSVTNARLLQSFSRSEMQVQVHSADFGRVTVHTAYGRDSISAQITLENAQLGSAVAAHVPAIEHKLGQDAGLRASVSVNTQAGNSGKEGQQSGGSPAKGRHATTHLGTGSALLPDSVRNVSSTSVYTGTPERGRLDIHI